MNIIVIDDNMKIDNPFLVELKINIPDANIILKNNNKEGLDYIMENINSKMIVLLDYDMGGGETGTEIFFKIREKTALIYIIIITAKMIENIPNKELAEYINKDALAIVDKTVSLKDRINLIKKAVHALDVRLDCVLEQWISKHSKKEQDEPYLTTVSGKEYTLKNILEEIRQQTEFGKSMERKIILLTVDLLTRGKKQIDD